jgi:acetyl esterase
VEVLPYQDGEAMPRSELESLFAMMQSAPQAQSIQELRASLEMFAPFINADPPAVAHVVPEVTLAPGVTADIIVPLGTPPFPTLIYLHGGGWTVGSPATHAKVARQLAVGAGMVVVNVGYRLAPEYPFPTGADDCVAAARWVRDNVAQYGGDPRRLTIGGDSAGGNLSAVVATTLAREIQFRAVLLLYGAFDLSGIDGMATALLDDPILPRWMIELMMRAYFSPGVDPADPRVSPLKADLSAFPPACLIVGTADPIVDQSIAMYEALRAGGREAMLHRFDGMPHGFLQFPVSDAAAAIGTACAFLRAHAS